MTNPLLELGVVGLVAGTMVVSWFFLFIPIFPGLNIIWVAALGWGIYRGFAWPAWLIFGLITILMVVGNLMDNIFISGKARLTGASWWSIIAGNLAGVLGAILLPPLGGLLFAVLGVLLVEIIRHKDWKKALHISKEMFFGFGWAILGRLGIGALMIGLWVVWAYQLI
jgi:uncharacterized protein YqgC (DUF456 family)